MNHEIRKARESDLLSIAEIYDRIHYLEDQGDLTTGWITGVYPILATAEAALARDDLFVWEEDDIIMPAAVINQVQVDSYADGKWQYAAEDDDVMVIHTLVVDPRHFRKGIGQEFIRFYEEYARAAGCKVLRLDTNERNTPARQMYHALGYSEADIVPCDFNGIPGIQLVLIEKSLSPV